MLAATDAAELYPIFSLDDRFFAFTSNETGQYNVYVMDVEVTCPHG